MNHEFRSQTRQCNSSHKLLVVTLAKTRIYAQEVEVTHCYEESVMGENLEEKILGIDIDLTKSLF